MPRRRPRDRRDRVGLRLAASAPTCGCSRPASGSGRARSGRGACFAGLFATARDRGARPGRSSSRWCRASRSRLLPRGYFGRRRRTRMREVQAAWPDGLRDIVASIAAGLSLTQAVTNLAATGPPALRVAFAQFPQLARVLGTGPALELLKEDLADATSDRVLEVLILAQERGGAIVREILDDLVGATTRDLKLLEELETEGLEMRINSRAVMVLPWLRARRADGAPRRVPRLLSIVGRRADARARGHPHGRSASRCWGGSVASRSRPGRSLRRVGRERRDGLLAAGGVAAGAAGDRGDRRPADDATRPTRPARTRRSPAARSATATADASRPGRARRRRARSALRPAAARGRRARRPLDRAARQRPARALAAPGGRDRPDVPTSTACASSARRWGCGAERARRRACSCTRRRRAPRCGRRLRRRADPLAAATRTRGRRPRRIASASSSTRSITCSRCTCAPARDRCRRCSDSSIVGTARR